ncbi:hypothetical protein BGZ59_005472 [Podila verticillata]|nr:hypothetical protein BGZ59_005472 [Podila verticillata]KFH63210.1 hypothetical protein MVEG_10621 [Podila verticillata NRRL 6337]
MATMATMTLAAPLEDTSEITDNNFQVTIDDPKYTLVEFVKNDCDICDDVKRRLKDIAPAYKTSLKVVSLNSDTNLVKPSQFTRQEFPALVLFHVGAYVAALTGDKSKSDIETFLENNHVLKA